MERLGLQASTGTVNKFTVIDRMKMKTVVNKQIVYKTQ